MYKYTVLFRLCWSIRTSVLSPNSLKLRFVTFNQTLLLTTIDHIKNQAVFLFLTQTLAVCLDNVNTLIPWKGDGPMMDSPVLLWLDCLAYRQDPKTAAHLSGRLITITRSVSLYIGINSDSLSNIIITAKGQHKTHTRCKIQSLRVKVKLLPLYCVYT